MYPLSLEELQVQGGQNPRLLEVPCLEVPFFETPCLAVGGPVSVSLGEDRKTLLSNALTHGNEKSIFQGLAMFEKCFLDSVKDTSYPCTK